MPPRRRTAAEWAAQTFERSMGRPFLDENGRPVNPASLVSPHAICPRSAPPGSSGTLFAFPKGHRARNDERPELAGARTSIEVVSRTRASPALRVVRIDGASHGDDVPAHANGQWRQGCLRTCLHTPRSVMRYPRRQWYSRWKLLSLMKADGPSGENSAGLGDDHPVAGGYVEHPASARAASAATNKRDFMNAPSGGSEFYSVDPRTAKGGVRCRDA